VLQLLLGVQKVLGLHLCHHHHRFHFGLGVLGVQRVLRVLGILVLQLGQQVPSFLVLPFDLGHRVDHVGQGVPGLRLVDTGKHRVEHLCMLAVEH